MYCNDYRKILPTLFFCRFFGTDSVFFKTPYCLRQENVFIHYFAVYGTMTMSEDGIKMQDVNTVVDFQVRIVYKGSPSVQPNQVSLSVSNGSQSLAQIWQNLMNMVAPNGIQELAEVKPNGIDFMVKVSQQDVQQPSRSAPPAQAQRSMQASQPPRTTSSQPPRPSMTEEPSRNGASQSSRPSITESYGVQPLKSDD